MATAMTSMGQEMQDTVIGIFILIKICVGIVIGHCVEIRITSDEML